MRRSRVVVAAAAALATAPLAAQSAPPGPAVPGDGFGFRAVVGWSSVFGDYGDLMDHGVPAEGGAWYQRGAVRVGFNLQVTSYDLVDPFDELSVSRVELNLSGTWRFRRAARLQPFVTGRVGAIRFRPEGALFDPNPPGPDVPPGENPAPSRTGLVGGLGGGVEYWLGRHVALEASTALSLYGTDGLDVPLAGLSGISDGGSADVRLGVAWAP